MTTYDSMLNALFGSHSLNIGCALYKPKAMILPPSNSLGSGDRLSFQSAQHYGLMCIGDRGITLSFTGGLRPKEARDDSVRAVALAASGCI